MSRFSKSEIEGLTLAITRLSAAGKSSKDMLNYLECEKLLGGTTLTSKKPTRRKRRKNLTLPILHILGSKGKKGAHVKVIADKLGTKPANITAWIYSTGRKVKGLKKVKPATYALVGK